MSLSKEESMDKDCLKIKCKGLIEYSFEKINIFIYLGILLTDRGGESEEIQQTSRCKIETRSARSLRNLFRSKHITRATKLIIYSTVIKPTALYGCESWILSKPSERTLDIWERKVLKQIFSGVKENGLWS